MNLGSMIVIGICAMLALATAVVFFVILYQRRTIAHQLELKRINDQKQRELLQASMRGEEEERMRIASELHDDVGATLASARLFLYRANDAAFDEKAINLSKELLDESIGKVRDISHKLQPATLQKLGLEQALAAMVDKIGQSGAIDARFVPETPIPRMKSDTELAAYRIAQELITNMLKHSSATSFEVLTKAVENAVAIVLTHDGCGLTQQAYEERIFQKGSTGLKNIVNRLEVINGSIHFYQLATNQFRTELKIPFLPPNTDTHEHHQVHNS